MLKLKEFRQNQQLTQAEISNILGIDQRQWSRYEKGTNEIPVRHIIKLCQYFKVSADEILGLLDTTPNPS